ncbi:MAG TPA: zinc ribbon domain-containing protein [Desulfobulbaceae bacterium]|nr:zinc ribbon domain-containing protein [Desulfobulbaceae bacterium]
MLTSSNIIDEIHICPNCGQKMACCQAPPIHVGDGLGWGSEYLFICLNDNCPLFLNGWEHCEIDYGHSASYRYMELPGSRESNVMMVAGKDAFKGSVVDKNELSRQDKRQKKIAGAVADLQGAEAAGNFAPALYLACEEAANLSDRRRAITILAKIAGPEIIDPLRNHKFRDPALEAESNTAIKAILERHYLRECPHCYELIKMRAKKCKHCGSEIA